MNGYLSRREFVRKMAVGSISVPVLIKSLERVLEAQPIMDRQPLLWLKGQSSGIHEATAWSTPGFFPFVNKHFQVLSSEDMEREDLTRRPKHMHSPILVLTGYITQDTESNFIRQVEDWIVSSRAVILYGNESAYGNKHPAEGLDIEKHLLRRNERPVIKLPGNPAPSRYLLGTLNHLILYNNLPDLDEYRRPRMFYAVTVCDRCEYRGDFEMGNFVRYFGEKEGCLYHLGCKGPITKNSCPTYMFNDSRSWCVSVGSPCTGCSESDFETHSGLGLYGALSPDKTGVNSFFVRNAGTMAKGVFGITVVGIGLHAVSRKASPPTEIHTESLDGKGIDE